MPHAPRPAGPVVLAGAPRGPHQAVAREDQQGLEPRVAAPGRPDRPHRRSGAPHPRGYAAVRGQVVVVREPPDVDRHRELRRGPRADAGHGEQARVGLVALEAETAARLAASPGRWATPSPAARARLTARDPMLRNWSTTTSVPAGAEANSASSSASLLRTGALASTSPSRSTRQAQCDDLPTSRPSTAAGLVDGAFTVVSFR